jgi:alkanesulfonate monooxygenase SsuD/methylene tetrahydromethanopterin reductase-like flavin-dependent oxidoreductase (luciferase family)
VWEDAVRAIIPMFREGGCEYHGRYFDFPLRNVVPKPLQKPHPPLWVACSRRDTIHLAAEKGIGALSFSFIEPSEAPRWVDDYYNTLQSDECVPGGFAVNPNLAVVVPLMCHRDEETAIERGLDGGHFFGYSLGHYYIFGTHQPGVTNVWEEFQKNRSLFGFDRSVAAQTGQVLGAQLFQQGLGSLRGAIGTPEQIRELVRGYADCGVDQIIFVSQSGRNEHEHICESLELFGSEVLPEFAETADEVEKAKLERLGPAMEAALARREPPHEAAEYKISAAMKV